MSDQTHSFNSNSFYGNKSRKRRYEIKSLIEKQVKKQTKFSLPEDFKSRIGGPSSSWKIFYKQNEAFRFAQSTSEDLHVFCYEKEVIGEEKGQRLYLVTSYPVFWHYYRQLNSDKKHHYEIIPEGSVCKVYFDIEYMKEYNPESNGSEMVQIFIKYVYYWLKKKFSISCDISDVLNLDASTEHKFSRHLIFQLKNAAFQNNIQLGYFVNAIMKKSEDIIKYKEMLSDSGIDVALEGTEDNKQDDKQINNTQDTLINKVDKQESCLDSKNIQGRNVNNKQQKSNTQNHFKNENKEVSNKEEACPMIQGHNLDDKQQTSMTGDSFNNKEVNYEDNSEKDTENSLKERNEILEVFDVEDLRTLFIYDKNGDITSFVDTGVYTKNRNFRLYLSSKLGKNNPLIISDDNQFISNTDDDVFLLSLISNVSYSDEVKILKFGDERSNEKGVSVSGRIKNLEETLEGDRCSPYPEIERFIMKIINNGDKHGIIRHWTYFTSGELLLFDIARYRYCDNIHRQHKSNNIMYVVDIRRGIYYQKCHDPDCKKQDFKSQDYEIPREYLPAYLLEQDDLMLNSDDDEELLQAMEDVETNTRDDSESKNLSDCDLSDNELLSITTEMENSSDLIHQ